MFQQDGNLCIFDLALGRLLQLAPLGHYSSSTAAAADTTDADVNAVASICFAPGSSDVLYAAVGCSVQVVDLRAGTAPMQQYSHNREEVSHVAVHHRGNYLAAADDAGEVQVGG